MRAYGFAQALIFGLFMSMKAQDNGDVCFGQPNGTFVIDPIGCQTFYLCLDDEPPQLASCPDGFWFDDESKRCDFEENVICHLYTTTSTTTTTTTTPRPTTTTTTSTTRTTTTTTTTTTRDPNVEDGVFCPGVDNPQRITFIPSQLECERYYICYHGRPMPMRCMEGFYWNQAARHCDYPSNAQCPLDPRPPSDFHCPRSSQGSVQPHPTDCDLYIYCLNGEAQIQKCPFYYHFDYQQQQCLIQDKAHCIVHKNKHLE